MRRLLLALCACAMIATVVVPAAGLIGAAFVGFEALE